MYFTDQSYCLLLIITQCGFLICSLCRIKTLAMPFNFQPTIFSKNCNITGYVDIVDHGVRIQKSFGLYFPHSGRRQIDTEYTEILFA